MPDRQQLELARTTLLVLASVGLFALALRMAVAGSFLRYPAFWSYTLLMGARYGQWALGRWDWHRTVESIIAFVCLLAVAEVWWKLNRDRHPLPRMRWVRIGLLAAVLACALTLKRLPPEPNPIRDYQRYWLAGQMAMAGWMAVAMAGNRLGLADRRLAAHGWVLAAHLLSRGLNFINYPSRLTEAERWAAYWVQQFVFLPLLLLCIVAWWWAMGKRTGRAEVP